MVVPGALSKEVIERRKVSVIITKHINFVELLISQKRMADDNMQMATCTTWSAPRVGWKHFNR
jgi:hypothetical protein